MANKALVIKIKQGEEKNIGLTIKANREPLDLSNYTIGFKVKNAPIEKARALINKDITTTSDINTVGQVTYPLLGQVVVHLTKADTSLPTGEYSLIINLKSEYYDDIISSDYCSNAKFIICEQ